MSSMMTYEACLLPCILLARFIAFETNLARESRALSLRAATMVLKLLLQYIVFLLQA